MLSPLDRGTETFLCVLPILPFAVILFESLSLMTSFMFCEKHSYYYLSLPPMVSDTVLEENVLP